MQYRPIHAFTIIAFLITGLASVPSRNTSGLLPLQEESTPYLPEEILFLKSQGVVFDTVEVVPQLYAGGIGVTGLRESKTILHKKAAHN